jgi:hypothetical protein
MKAGFWAPGVDHMGATYMDMATDQIPHAVKTEAYSIELNVETPIIPGSSTALHAPHAQLVLWPCPVY